MNKESFRSLPSSPSSSWCSHGAYRGRRPDHKSPINGHARARDRTPPSRHRHPRSRPREIQPIVRLCPYISARSTCDARAPRRPSVHDPPINLVSPSVNTATNEVSEEEKKKSSRASPVRSLASYGTGLPGWWSELCIICGPQTQPTSVSVNQNYFTKISVSRSLLSDYIRSGS